MDRLKIFFAFVLFLLFFGCAKGRRSSELNSWMGDSKELRVLCTTAQIGDLVAAIGGERVKIWVLIQGDLDPHSYELVKGDGEKIQNANLIFYNGLNLEHGVSLSELLRQNPQAFPLGDAIASQHPEKVLKKDSVIDPHLWMDASIWSLGVDPILGQLSLKDPEGASYYNDRAIQLSKSLNEVHLQIKERLNQIPEERRYLLTSHDAFRYFAKAYLATDKEDTWEKRFAAPEGLAPDGQLSPVDIQRMIVFVKEHRTEVVFPESNVSRDSVKKIALAGKELGLNVRVCPETLYGDSMSGLSYFEMMEKNADILARYLSNGN